MPIPLQPVQMNGSSGPSSSLSPISPRTAKAGLFRARSPGIEVTSHSDFPPIDPFGLGRRDINGPGSSSDGHGLVPPRGNRSVEGGYASSAGASIGHTPPIADTAKAPRPLSPPITADLHMRSMDDRRPSAVSSEIGTSRSTVESSSGLASGSDEMLMTLLAGQAAVDCEQLPIGGWEEVESWNKELTLLSTRVEALVARHQREVKILTAARTLQKLNNANKRMSKQTMESLEQAEKRAEAAEKEMLILRDREASLRRRLMEHWSGVMAWEVRRLERISIEAHQSSERALQLANDSQAREEAIARRAEEMAADLERNEGRVSELEEMIVEFGRRERAAEEEIEELKGVNAELEQEKAALAQNQGGLEGERAAWDRERRAFEAEKQAWMTERKQLMEDRESVVKARALERSTGQMSEKDRQMIDRVKVGLSGILGKKGGIPEGGMGDAVEEVKRLLQAREDEVVRLKEEVREVNMGLEEEVRRAVMDRDAWKARAEKGERSDSARSADMANLEKQLRSHKDQISDLSLRNESLSTSLQAAQAAVSQHATTADSSKSLQNKVDALTAELDSIAGQFNEVWKILPPKSRRLQAELIDPQSGRSNTALISPSRAINFAALQQMYMPHDEGFKGIDEMLNRVRGMVEDGKVLVERVCRLGQERELLKHNAGRAKKLAEDSRASLETYQRQVAVLEDQLAKSGASESKSLEELNSLRQALDNASASKRQMEASVNQSNEICERLTSANDALSAKVLSLAEDADAERQALSKKWQDELDEMRRQRDDAHEDADESKTRGQAQRIQLLDELNSLQAENGELRKQLRAAKK